MVLPAPSPYLIHEQNLQRQLKQTFTGRMPFLVKQSMPKH